MTPPVPTVRLVRLVLMGSPLWLALLASPGGWIPPVAYLLVLLGLAAREYRMLPDGRLVGAERQLPRFTLGEVHDVVLSLENRSSQDLEIAIRDELPAALRLETPIAPALAPRRHALDVTYRVAAVRRGAHAFGDIALRLGRPRGLVQREIRAAPAAPRNAMARIYPRLSATTDYRLLARIDRRDYAVRRPRRVFGSGTDFESLAASQSSSKRYL
jgi:uncharacterized protein (DUF58 family)